MASHVHRSRSDYYRMDMGKNTLHMIGLDKRGAIMLRKNRGLRTCHRVSLVSKRVWQHTMLLVNLPRLATTSARKHILAWPAKTVLTAHGTAVEKDARAYLSRAFG
jgi:hypothetical protein